MVPSVPASRVDDESANHGIRWHTFLRAPFRLDRGVMLCRLCHVQSTGNRGRVTGMAHHEQLTTKIDQVLYTSSTSRRAMHPVNLSIALSSMDVAFNVSAVGSGGRAQTLQPHSLRALLSSLSTAGGLLVVAVTCFWLTGLWPGLAITRSDRHHARIHIHADGAPTDTHDRICSCRRVRHPFSLVLGRSSPDCGGSLTARCGTTAVWKLCCSSITSARSSPSSLC